MTSVTTGDPQIGRDHEVDVVIVNWNSGSYLKECIAALDQSTVAKELRVIVVDNASTDGSIDGLVSNRIALLVVRNKDNLGFAIACNLGAVRGTAQHLLFLNPDVRVRQDTIERTIAYMEDSSKLKVGIVGVQLIDPRGRLARSCTRKPTGLLLILRAIFLDRLFPSLVKPHFLLEWDHREDSEVPQVMGAYLAIRRSLFKELGGFDERFFLYYEDLDLCVRAAHAGWKVMYHTGAAAEHVGGGTTEAIKFRRMFYDVQNRSRYALKHHGFIVAFLLTILAILAEIPVRLVHVLVSNWAVLIPEEGYLRKHLKMSWCCDKDA